jgi:hypothetical protein
MIYIPRENKTETNAKGTLDKVFSVKHKTKSD